MDGRDPRPRSRATPSCPPGVFNLVHGGETTGRAARRRARRRRRLHRLGRGRARDRAQDAGGPTTRGRPLTEMGGKNPAIVTAHADLDAAAEGVARAAFGLAGPEVQRVLARDRGGRVHDAFVERLAAWTRAACRSATPPTARASLGPVVNAAGGRALRGRRRRAARRDGRRGRRRRPSRPAGLLRRADRRRRPAARPSRWTRDELFLPFVTVTRGRLARRGAGRGQRRRLRADGRASSARTQAEVERFLDEIEAGVRLRQPPRGRHHRRLAGHPDVLRLEVAAARPARAASGRTTSRSSCASRAGPWSDRAIVTLGTMSCEGALASREPGPWPRRPSAAFLLPPRAPPSGRSERDQKWLARPRRKPTPPPSAA